MRRRTAAAALMTVVLALAGCGGSPDKTASSAPAASGAGSAQGVAPSVPATQNASSSAAAAPPANNGNPGGRATVPAEARAVDTSKPTRVVGNGTPGSCTSEAVVSAVAAGGIITFSCGPEPVTITMKATAKVKNVQGAKIVLDGGGKVTLSGEGRRRILYMNTCDQKQGWTTSHCQDQDHPSLTVQNLTFADGNSTGETAEGGGGGAIFVRGGRFKVVNSRFVRNRCDQNGPDLGGAAIRVLSQFHNQPVYVVGSTFGGASGQGGVCANGGALSSIGVSWVVLNSVLSYNSAVGKGANPARAGTPGAAAAVRSTATATCSPSGSPGRSSSRTRRTRAAGRCSSSATTAAARCRSRARRCGRTRAPGSRRRASPASSSSAPGPRRCRRPH
ncbi:hypothetical protein [Dactylosporangium cerinum]